ERCAAVVQAFFPGEEGGPALAGVLSGRVNPSGRLPVSLPRSAGAQPFSYLHPPLGGPTDTSTLDPTPPLPFGHGLSYTSFARTALTPASPQIPTDGTLEVSVEVRNTGEREGSDVVQLYARDVVASVTRPIAQLLGYRRVDLAPGEAVTVRFSVPTTRLAFTDRRLRRVVEPGTVELWVGPSCARRETEARVELVGAVHEVGPDDPRWVGTSVSRGCALRARRAGGWCGWRAPTSVAPTGRARRPPRHRSRPSPRSPRRGTRAPPRPTRRAGRRRHRRPGRPARYRGTGHAPPAGPRPPPGS